MRRPLWILILLFCAFPLVAADKWTRVRSQNFTLIGNATEGQIRDVAENLEVFRTAFSRFFKVKDGASVATTVLVFRSDQAFKPFKPVYQGKPANIDGFFQPGDDINIIALAADMQTPRVIYHEFVHRLMSDTLGSLPPWFQEGFAECFSTLEIEGRDKRVRLGRAIGEHVELLNQRQFMPLEKLFAVEFGSPEYNEQDKQGLFYAESWALVHYMMFDSDQRRAQFNEFLSAIAAGKKAPEAFRDVFNMDLDTFQDVFEAYIQQRMAWNAFEIKTPSGLDRSKGMSAHVISEGEAESYLGDLLLRLDRLPEAETHLTKAVQLEPKLGGAQATMGRLFRKKGNEEDALAYLKRATELDSDNYLTHYYYASLIRGKKTPLSDTDWTTIRTELQRSIELAPQFVEAVEMLANVNLARNADIPQTIELLGKAIAIAPGRDYLVLEIAAAYSRTPQREVARPLVRSLLARQTLEPQMRQDAQSLLQFLDRAAAMDAANRVRTEQRSPAADSQATTEIADLPTRELRSVTNPDPAGVAQPAPVSRDANLLPAGNSRIRGILTQLDCSNGLTLVLAIDGKIVRLRSTNPNAIKFTSFNSAVSGTITCGTLPGNGVPASIAYRPQETADSLGDPQMVDFLESLDDTPRTSPLPRIAGTSIVKGTLVALDCSRGVSLSVNSEGKTLRFHTDSAANVAFLNGPNPDGTVNCGAALPQGLTVTVLYRPGNSADSVGEPVVVQFQKN